MHSRHAPSPPDDAVRRAAPHRRGASSRPDRLDRRAGGLRPLALLRPAALAGALALCLPLAGPPVTLPADLAPSAIVGIPLAASPPQDSAPGPSRSAAPPPAVLRTVVAEPGTVDVDADADGPSALPGGAWLLDGPEAEQHLLQGLGPLDGACRSAEVGQGACPGPGDRVSAGTEVAGLTATALAAVALAFWVLRRWRENRAMRPRRLREVSR